MLSRARQNMCRRLWQCPRMSKIFLESETLVCSVTTGTKTTLGIIQLWFNYFAASLLNALGIYFSWEAKERNAPVVAAFTPVSFIVYGDDHTSLPIFRCSSRTPGHLTKLAHTSKNSLIQGSEHFITACSLQCIGTKGDFSCSDGIFLPQMYLVCVRWCSSDWVQEIFKILPSSTKDVTLISV